MVSVFRSIFKGKFPEHSELESALENLRGYGLKIIDNDTKAFSPCFDHFAASQSASVKPGLIQVGERGNEQVAAMKQLFTAASALPTEMTSLKQMNLEMQKRLSGVQSAEGQAQKAQVEYDKANAAFEKARARSNTVEMAKWEQKSDAAKFKVEQDQRAVEDAKAGFEKFHETYRVDFVRNLGSALQNAVDAKLKELSELSRIAQGIIDAAATITETEEGGVERHRKRLEAIEAELAQG